MSYESEVEPVPLRRRLRAALPRAMKSGDRVAVSALRSTLAALDNAEAVDAAAVDAAAVDAAAGDTAAAGGSGLAIERSPVGVGAADRPRRVLTAADVDRLVRAEVAEREQAAREYDRVGRPEQAQRLRAEAAVLAAHLAASG